MAYLTWDDDKPRPKSPYYWSAACHSEAAELFAQMAFEMRDMDESRPLFVAVDDENGGPVEVFAVRRTVRFEAVKSAARKKAAT